MDIKPTKPSLLQEAGNALDPKSVSPNLPSLLSQFNIRTMAGDLAQAPPGATQTSSAATGRSDSSRPPLADVPKASGVTLPAPPSKTSTPPAPPAPESVPPLNEIKTKKEQPATLAQTAKETQRAAAEKIKEKEREQHQELLAVFEQAKLKLAAKEFDAAIGGAQKIIDHPAASWLDKWNAKRLIDKAQKDAEQKIAEPAAVPPPPAAAFSPPKPTIAPRGNQSTGAAPVNLPIIDEIATAKVAPPPASPAFKAPVTPQTFATAPKIVAPADERNAPSKAPPAPLPKPAPAKPVLLPTVPASEPAEELDIKKVAVAGITSLAVLALIIWGIWFFLKQTPSQPQATQSPSPQPTLATQTPKPTPTPLFESDSQRIFELKTGQEKANFQEAVAQISQTEEPAERFISLIFKDSQDQFLSLTKISSLAEIDLFDIPTQTSAGPLKNQLEMARFSFFAYSQSNNSSSPFISSLNSGRLGLIIALKNSTSSTAISDLTKSLKDVEQLMLPSLKVLLPEVKNALPTQPNWQDNSYKNTAIRYVNLPDANLSLDYAILNNKLIFATSKESVYALIDRLLTATD